MLTTTMPIRQCPRTLPLATTGAGLQELRLRRALLRQSGWHDLRREIQLLTQELNALVRGGSSSAIPSWTSQTGTPEMQVTWPLIAVSEMASAKMASAIDVRIDDVGFILKFRIGSPFGEISGWVSQVRVASGVDTEFRIGSVYQRAPKERRRRRAEKQLSKTVFLESPFLLSPLKVCP